MFFRHQLMRYLIIFAYCILIITSIAQDLNAQGCSDAGVCTMGAIGYDNELKTDSNNTNLAKKFKHNIGLGQSISLGEQNVMHLLSLAEINASVKSFTFQVKIPFAINIGNLANTNGLSDIATSISYFKQIKNDHKISITLGYKIPTNRSDLKINNMALPMPYQTSLGTHDIVFGVSYRFKALTFVTGYQKVIHNINRNTFDANNPLNTEDAKKYFSSYLFERSDDAILKIDHSVTFKNNWKFNQSALAIFRVNEDRSFDTSLNRQIDIPNSKGLTLNLILNLTKEFKNNNSIDISLASPIIVRKVRPDGLTRSAIASLIYRFSLN